MVGSQVRREAVVVEIGYAVLPSALFVVVAVVAGAVLARLFELRGAAWGVVGTAGLVVTVLAALTRTLAVLFRARRSGGMIADVIEKDSVEYRLRKAREREHVLVAIARAQDEWADLLRVVSEAADADDARRAVAARFDVDGDQATAMLEMQVRRVSEESRRRIRDELEALRHQIRELADNT